MSVRASKFPTHFDVVAYCIHASCDQLWRPRWARTRYHNALNTILTELWFHTVRSTNRGRSLWLCAIQRSLGWTSCYDGTPPRASPFPNACTLPHRSLRLRSLISHAAPYVLLVFRRAERVSCALPHWQALRTVLHVHAQSYFTIRCGD